MAIRFALSGPLRRLPGTALGVVAGLAVLELVLHPLASQLRPPPPVVIACDSIDSPAVATRQTEEGVALARYSRCGARLTGNPFVSSGAPLVLLGDSYVAAREVDDDETMGARLEAIARDSDRPLAVRQYGWPGASPARYLMVANDVLNRWRPERVVIAVNDDDLGLNTTEGPPPRLKLLPAGHVVVDTSSRGWSASPGAPPTFALLGLMEHRWTMIANRSPWIIRRLSGPPDAPLSLLGEAVLADVPEAVVRALSDAYGRRLLIVYLADVRVVGGTAMTQKEELLLAACARHRVHCASTRSDMLAARSAGRAVRGSVTTTLGIGHLNPDGHDVVARLIWRELQRGD